VGKKRVLRRSITLFTHLTCANQFYAEEAITYAGEQSQKFMRHVTEINSQYRKI